MMIKDWHYDDFIDFDKERNVWQAKDYSGKILFEGLHQQVLNFMNKRLAAKCAKDKLNDR